MGSEASRVVTGVSWWLVDLVSRMLEQDERAAVRGDLAESGETAAHALRDVIGLVARRQAAMWMDWRPWLALMGVVVPLGMVLSVISRSWADRSALDAYWYVNNGEWSFLAFPGWRLDVFDTITATCLNYLALIGWSWASGFVLGRLSRRAVWVTGALFCVMVVAGTLGTTTTTRMFNADVFASTFYRVVFPRILRIMLVLVPVAFGIRRGLQEASLPLVPTMLGALAITLLTAWTAKSLQASVLLGWWNFDVKVYGLGHVPQPSALWQLLPVVVLWPVGYAIAAVRSRHRPSDVSCDRG